MPSQNLKGNPQGKRRRNDWASVEETLLDWKKRHIENPSENNGDIKNRKRKGAPKGSRKGCMQGKGGPENSNCPYRGVRQRTWGKWVAEIREPVFSNNTNLEEGKKKPKRLWLGTFPDSVGAALAYDKAALIMYGSDAVLNFPNSCSAGDTQSCVASQESPPCSEKTCLSGDEEKELVEELEKLCDEDEAFMVHEESRVFEETCIEKANVCVGADDGLIHTENSQIIEQKTNGYFGSVSSGSCNLKEELESVDCEALTSYECSSKLGDDLTSYVVDDDNLQRASESSQIQPSKAAMDEFERWLEEQCSAQCMSESPQTKDEVDEFAKSLIQDEYEIEDVLCNEDFWTNFNLSEFQDEYEVEDVLSNEDFWTNLNLSKFLDLPNMPQSKGDGDYSGALPVHSNIAAASELPEDDSINVGLSQFEISSESNGRPHDHSLDVNSYNGFEEGFDGEIAANSTGQEEHNHDMLLLPPLEWPPPNLGQSFNPWDYFQDYELCD